MPVFQVLAKAVSRADIIREVSAAPLSLPAKHYRPVHMPFRVADDAGNQPVYLQPSQTLLRNLVLEFAVSVV
jgi:hypothetical protein